jgi:predicted Zn finger-like uncharacterized protein
MPRSRIDLKKVRESLNATCTECGASIPPNEQERIDSGHMRCPHCGKMFIQEQKSPPIRTS